MTEPIEVRVPMMPGIMSDHEMQQTIVDKLLAAGVPVVSTMQGATVTKGNDRLAAGESLDHSDPEIFFAGHDKRRTASVQIAEFLVGNPAAKFYRSGCEFAQPRKFRPSADNFQGPPRLRKQPDRVIEALIRDHLRHHQEIVLRLAVMTHRSVNRWIDHPRISAVSLPDALSHIAAIGKEPVHAGCR